MRIKGTVMSVNYGRNRVRFVQAVPVRSRIRTIEHRFGRASTQSARIATSIVIEIDGVQKPAAIAEMIELHLLDDSPSK